MRPPRTAALNRGRTSERGQVGGIEMLPFGLLIFVVGTLLLLNAWRVIDSKMAAEAAAREFVRSYVEAVDATSAWADGSAAATEAVVAHGSDPELMTLPDRTALGPFAACQPVTAEITIVVPAISLPFIGGLGELTVRADHTEQVDGHRSGVARIEAGGCG